VVVDVNVTGMFTTGVVVETVNVDESSVGPQLVVHVVPNTSDIVGAEASFEVRVGSPQADSIMCKLAYSS
jgi:hypothetical protein